MGRGGGENGEKMKEQRARVSRDVSTRGNEKREEVKGELGRGTAEG